MNQTISTVFKIVGVLVVIFLFWQLMWNSDGTKNGIFITAYNAVASRINVVYQASRGADSKLLPEYDGGSLTHSSDLLTVYTASDFDLSTGS